MAIAARVRTFLDDSRVAYQVRVHREVYTTQEAAAAAHITGRRVAKVLVLKGAAGYSLAVLPAACRASLERLRVVSDDPTLALAPEREFERLFPECEPGAMPPFGNLYGMRVLMDEELAKSGEIACEAGNHHELLTLRAEDFVRLVQPTVGEFCTHADRAAA
jgi:Ala-tRNA(Pro) deacylase